MLTDQSFARRLIDKYKTFGRFPLETPELVLVKRDNQESVSFLTKRNFQFKLQLNMQNPPQTRQLSIVNWNLFGREIMNHSYREFQVFRYISTIFENRDRQPDAARKAERKLIQILEEDFYTKNFNTSQETEKKLRRTFMKHNRQLIQEEFKQTGTQIMNLEERMAVHEKVLKEFRQTKTTEGHISAVQIDKITKEVMKKMEHELHLERLRRGL